MSRQWKPTKLAEILTPAARVEAVDPTKEYRLLGIRLDGGGPFLRETVTGSESAATKLFKVKSGDFIYSRLFAWRGAFGVIEHHLDSCYVSGEFPTFEAVPDKIDTEFLRLWFRLPSIIERVEADCTGSTPLTRNRFKENFFLDLEIPLPPLSEQQRIVTRIEELASKITGACSLRQWLQGEARALFSARRRTVFGSFKHTTPLGELLELTCGGAWGETDDPKGVGVLRPNAIDGSGHLVFTDIRFRAVRDKQVKKLLLTDGDIILTKSNSIELVGNAALFARRAGDTRCYIPSNFLQLLRVNTTRVEPQYLWHYIMSPEARLYWQKEAAGTSPSLQNLNSTAIKRLLVPLPPLREQQSVIAYLNGVQIKVDALKKLQAETAAELAALLPSILDKAFKGELQSS